MAFCGGSSSHFILDVDETTSTLLEFDIVDLDKPVRKELLESIKREGVVLYEKFENFKAALVNLNDIFLIKNHMEMWKLLAWLDYMKSVLNNHGRR